MDKSWLNIRNRVDQKYRDGVEDFLNWAFSQPEVNTMIRCPCKRCMNTVFKLRIDVRGDLLKKGFWDSYKVWDLHGEVLVRDENSNIAFNDEVEVNSTEENDITQMIHDIKTKYGGKINIITPDDIDRAVGSGARDIVNYSGLIMRSSISFQDGNWQKIVLKHGEAMWYKVKDKFEVCGGLREHKLQGFVISTMQRLLRAWKARLHKCYSA